MNYFGRLLKNGCIEYSFLFSQVARAKVSGVDDLTYFQTDITWSKGN